MTKAVLNEEKHSQLCSEAVSLARAILSDDEHYLSNVIKLNSLRFELGENEFDKDFVVFLTISSDTDHIPYGKNRENCSVKWLEKCDKELCEIKEHYRGEVEKSCKSIIERFGKNA